MLRMIMILFIMTTASRTHASSGEEFGPRSPVTDDSRVPPADPGGSEDGLKQLRSCLDFWRPGLASRLDRVLSGASPQEREKIIQNLSEELQGSHSSETLQRYFFCSNILRTGFGVAGGLWAAIIVRSLLSGYPYSRLTQGVHQMAMFLAVSAVGQGLTSYYNHRYGNAAQRAIEKLERSVATRPETSPSGRMGPSSAEPADTRSREESSTDALSSPTAPVASGPEEDLFERLERRE